MNIVAVDTDKVTTVTEYFDFNRIPYTSCDFWNSAQNNHGRHEIPTELLQSNNTLLVLDYTVFADISSAQLGNFCSNNNKIWVWGHADMLIAVLGLHQVILELDLLIPANSMYLFIDGKISDRVPIVNVSNIQYVELPYSFFVRYPRIENAIVNKSACSKDYLLTSVKKPSRPHRDILWQQLNTIDGLIDRGHVNYRSVDGKRIGAQPHQTTWCGYPSMDLYQDSWVEIVPETMFQDGFFVTEKTIKPIATKTPFLIVSTCRYLEYLNQFGFRTFGNIIDERYDQHYLIEDRVRLMLAQLQDIIKNGTEAFYKECAPVLEHNQNRLLEIHGRVQYDTDVFIAKNLAQAGIK